ncbi:hypothetical protein K445DRAFT_314190 [Daldinia sp. EC12]|nr:hypothetical protein K445DRAFT_314190 [Daldinia sp. EC12]
MLLDILSTSHIHPKTTTAVTAITTAITITNGQSYLVNFNFTNFAPSLQFIISTRIITESSRKLPKLKTILLIYLHTRPEASLSPLFYANSTEAPSELADQPYARCTLQSLLSGHAKHSVNRKSLIRYCLIEVRRWCPFRCL